MCRFVREGKIGKYLEFHEHTLDPSECSLSDAGNFRQRNQSIYERMQQDPSFKREMQTKYPGVVEHVQSSSKGQFKGKTPSRLMRHYENKPYILSFIDKKDHKNYHSYGFGGRKK